MFGRYGIPKEIVSDNGPCFHSTGYKRFSDNWDFKHTKISPQYPTSNGMVERTIQTVKKTIRKCRTTPKGDGISPLVNS